MANDDDLKLLRTAPVPDPGREARERAVHAALESFDAQKNAGNPQGSAAGRRPSGRMAHLWRTLMGRKLLAAPAMAGLVALPIAGYVTWQFVEQAPFGSGRLDDMATGERVPAGRTAAPEEQAGERSADLQAPAAPAPDAATREAPALHSGNRLHRSPLSIEQSKPMTPPADAVVADGESRDRFAVFDDNPVRSVPEDPVSTFSIDVDTASYAFVRRALKEGAMPPPDSVRVEEMINYFPYDWDGPQSAETPFNADVTVMPTPWNEGTKLMHVAVKGYDAAQLERPRANLVFLIDVSGSMSAGDKLPLLKNAFRLLVDRLGPDDTVSIVTYAGDAGTVLENVRASQKDRILDAIDRLEPGGRTAGQAGIEEAYKLAEQGFVEGGVNRVMLATDGDFNVGQFDDRSLKRLIEDKRDSGVYLSVFGFGRGNLNDQLMQTLAQNGNGTAAYIDTLAEAEKTLVEEASSTMVPIANDVKIQVEFNPERIAEYRLIGYEMRALEREDFNNDRVDAGDIGSGHSVTAIYEITPVGSPAAMIDDLHYGEEPEAAGDGSDEYAFVKMRYKRPGEDESQLVTTAVTPADELGSLGQASDDVRFSVAVAAFGQKLRDTGQTASFGYDRIMEIATAARGSDPFGYRAEFLSLVRLASALDGDGR